MTPQAKNRVLAYIVVAMLSLVAISGILNVEAPKTNVPVTILIPQKNPVFVTITEAPELVAYDQEEFECLRLNIYHEAGNQKRKGKEAVALVTMNRAKTKHFPSTICGVVTQAVVRNGVVVRNMCQFSWYCDGKGDMPNLRNPLERKAWEEATAVATAAMQGKINDFLGRATHYHATYVRPGWASASRIRKLTQVGSHIFYRDIKLALKHNT